MAGRTEIIKGIGILAAAFPNFKLTKETLEVYIMSLSDIPGDVLSQVIKQLIAEKTFFPAVAEVRNACYEIVYGALGIPTPFEAWENALDQIDRCGYYWKYTVRGREPEYIHPFVEKAVNQIGYSTVLESRNIGIERAHFIKAYESIVESAREHWRKLPATKALSKKYAGGLLQEARENLYELPEKSIYDESN